LVFEIRKFQSSYCEFERAAEVLQTSSSERNQFALDSARHHLRLALDSVLDQIPKERHSLLDTLGEIRHQRAAWSRASAALLLALRNPSILNGGERVAITILEDGIPEILAKLRYPERRAQSYEKLALLRGAFDQIVQPLDSFRHVGTSLEEIFSRRTDMIRALSDKPVAWYLQQLGRDNIKAEIQTLFNRTSDILTCEDGAVESYSDALGAALHEYDERLGVQTPLWLTNTYGSFIRSLTTAHEQFRLDIQHRLVANVVLATEGEELTRKQYPLHEEGRPITVSIPIANLGPGMAKAVQAQLSVDSSIAVVDTDIPIGDLPPGPFDLSVQIMMLRRSKSLYMQVHLSWTTPGSIVREANSADIVLHAQRPDVPWEKLTHQEPYSTEVAEGDEFYGRKEKLVSVARRLMTLPMRSTYITGQKRVGKTSLAKAVAAHIEATPEHTSLKFSYIEWGSYARSDPNATVYALGNRIASDLQSDLPAVERLTQLDFNGTLAPLIDVAQHLRKRFAHTRYVVMLDEFDEIHQEMYRIGPLAEVLFSNLRTLASQKNLALVLIGGEKMPFVIAAQGDQLNKFVRESLDYFSADSEWPEYCDLVEKPTTGSLTWRTDAVKAVFDLTRGHPYYTKLVCGRVFQNAVSQRDSDITIEEVRRAARTIILDLDVNAFAHYWKDGIPGDKDDEEARSTLRAKYLAAAGRLLRQGKAITTEGVSAQKELFRLDAAEVFPITREFCNRGIMKESGGEEYVFTVPLFGDWLRDVGVDSIVLDTLSEEISQELRKSQEASRVSAGELTKLVGCWPPYRGQEVTAEKVRAWLDQVADPREQRLLFKLLGNVRFVTEIDVRNKLKVAFSMLTPHLPVFVRQSRAAYRNDLVVCYIDGQGKSGQYYASRFAEENGIAARCVTAATDFQSYMSESGKVEGHSVAAVAIIDDIVATGGTLSKKVADFISAHRSVLQESNAFVAVIALLGTAKGEEAVRRRISQLGGVNVELRICEPIAPACYAFVPNCGIWTSEGEMQQAKALCVRLGSAIYGNNPLGYGDMGLLVTFPSTCPNNTLPILHSFGKGERAWSPLFPRPVN
jgi:hypothetical protein